MLCNMFKRKSVWITSIIYLCLLLIIICVVVIKFFGGPRNFIDYCLEIINGDIKKHTWVFLVAGSKGFDNYRHQADIAHAYQTLLNNGVPYDHIIVMMTDDVVNDTRNPIPGQLFNHPNGSDVYRGLRVDYSGENVNSANFLHILTGNKAAMQNLGSSRVVESNHGDNIFVNFVGHGSSGIIAFNDNYLFADELNNALQLMFENRKFNKMLLYIEACRSGSLFDGILSETNNIFAVTAAGPRENSWSIYCFEESETHEKICLGDAFSVTWIEDLTNVELLRLSKGNNFFIERTVLNQFNYVRSSVKSSNVMPYGDFSVGQDKLSAYIGKIPRLFSTNNIQSTVKNNVTTMSGNKILKNPIKIYQQTELQNGKNNTIKQKIRVRNYHTMKQILDEVFSAILQGVINKWPELIGDINELKQIPSNLPLNIFPCYRQTLDHITKNCFSLPKIIYSFDVVHIFSNLCKRVINNSKFNYIEFDVVFEKVIQDVCSKSSTFLNLQKMIDIY